MNVLRAFARPMLAASFVLDGVDALTRPARHVERFEKVSPLLEKVGLPPVLTSDARMLTRACGAVSVAAGLGLATSRAPRTCAAVLAGLNIPLTLVNNPVWAVKGKEARKAALSGLARGDGLPLFLAVRGPPGQGRAALARDGGQRPVLGVLGGVHKPLKSIPAFYSWTSSGDPVVFRGWSADGPRGRCRSCPRLVLDGRAIRERAALRRAACRCGRCRPA